MVVSDSDLIDLMIQILLSVLCLWPGTLYKVFIPAKANMFLLEGKAYTMKNHSLTQYSTSILGHHRGEEGGVEGVGESNLFLQTA